MNHSDPLVITDHKLVTARLLIAASLRATAILLLGAILFLSLPQLNVLGQTSGSFNVAHLSNSGLLIVGIDADRGTSGLDALRAQGFAIETYWPALGLATVRVAEIGAADISLIQEAAERVQSLSGVTHASGDALLEAAVLPAPILWQATGAAQTRVEALPDDPLVDQQWAITRTVAQDGWQMSQGSPSVTIALIDSGFDDLHVDFDAASRWQNRAEVTGITGVDDDGNGFVDDFHGWDWIDADGLPNDPYGHGTHTGGIISAASNNSRGIAGYASSVRILPLRILDAYGGGKLSDLLAALEYALVQEVDVINLSLTTNSDQPALAQAVEVLADAGILLVAATGNQAGPVVWPAAYTDTLAVAATTADDSRATFSNFGPAVDVVAPGEAILSLYSHDDYAFMDGTSMAVPHVAALAGLLASLRPDLSGPQLGQLIMETAVDVNADALPGHDPDMGAGRIDFAAALLAATAQLRLAPAAQADWARPVFANGAVDLEWFLSVAAPTGAELPVAGARGTFQLYAIDKLETPLAGGIVQSDEMGRIVAAFAAPARPGEYLLRLTIGAVEESYPLLVSTPLTEVHLAPQLSIVQAGSAPQAIAVEVRAAQSRPITSPMSIELVTTLGFLGDERTRRVEIQLDNGRGEVLFDPGLAAGTAQVKASIGGVSGLAEIEILPGLPESVQLPSLPAQVAVMDEPVLVELEIRVADRFGNPVVDGTEVELAASDGNLIILDRTTAQGVLVANLMVSAADVSPVQLRAVVPDSPAQAEADLTLQSNHQWLPIVTQMGP